MKLQIWILVVEPLIEVSEETDVYQKVSAMMNSIL